MFKIKNNKIFLFCICLITLFACEKRKFSPVKSVPIPVTLDEVRTRYGSREFQIRINRKTIKKGGGGSCHALPVCVIVGAAHLYAGLFPKQYDEVIIRKDKHKIFFGTFSTDGNLLQGRYVQNGVFKDYGRFDLQKLERKFIIQIYEGTLTNGTEIVKRKVSVLSQVDLLADYNNALEDEDEALRRGALIVEAMHWLGQESQSFVVKRLKDSEEPGQSRAMIVAAICRTESFPIDLINHVLPQPGAHAAAQAFHCYLNNDKPIKQILPFISDMVGGLCRREFKVERKVLFMTNVFYENTKIVDRLRKSVYQQKQDTKIILTEHIRSELVKCKPEPGGTVAKYAFNMDVPPEEISDAFADTYARQWLLKNIDLENARSREGFYIALEKGHSRGALLKRLSLSYDSRKLETSSKELALLANLYSKGITARDYRGYQPHIMFIFRHFGNDREKTSQARKLLKEAFKTSTNEEQPAVAIALFVLGESKYANEAARALTSNKSSSGMTAFGRERIRGVDRQVHFGFKLAGCSPDDIQKIRETLNKQGNIYAAVAKCLEIN